MAGSALAVECGEQPERERRPGGSLRCVGRRSTAFKSAAQLLLVVAASPLHERACSGSAA